VFNVDEIDGRLAVGKENVSKKASLTKKKFCDFESIRTFR